MPVLHQLLANEIPLAIGNHLVFIADICQFSGRVHLDLSTLPSDYEVVTGDSVTIVGGHNREQVSEHLPRIAHYAIVDSIKNPTQADIMIWGTKAVTKSRTEGFEREFEIWRTTIQNNRPKVSL
jgi:hypothetical protein